MAAADKGLSIEDVDLEKYDYIPATQRPDGTWRAARKVKKGYVPPDEQPKFQTRAVAARPQQIPGFVPGMDPNELNAAKEKPKTKNQKRNENKKKKAEEGGAEDGGESAAASVAKEPAAAAPAAPEDPKEALAKKVRNIKKKVKQTDELQTKVAAGEQLNPEQKEKLSKRAELEAEIKQLEEEMAKL